MKRQLAAILHADVVGYSRLMANNEYQTLEDLKAGLSNMISQIEKAGGEKVNEAGDAVLAEFPSAVAAVECAINFQQVMADTSAKSKADQKLQFRVGINVGEVIHERGDIYGDGVNLAARIQDLAEPGGISISSTVYEQVNGKMDLVFDDTGYHTVKNISQPVHVFRVNPRDQVLGQQDRPEFDFESMETDQRALITGGCQCGEIRYEITQPAMGTGICHCRMCQRSIGAVLDAWSAFSKDAVRFISGEPKFYQSSPIAKRGFCSTCGSSLLLKYNAPTESSVLIIMTACLDNPEDFAPAWHGCTESQVPWLDINDGLPRTLSKNSTDLNNRWSAMGVSDPSDWK